MLFSFRKYVLLVYLNKFVLSLFILQGWLRESPEAFSPVACVFLTAEGGVGWFTNTVWKRSSCRDG